MAILAICWCCHKRNKRRQKVLLDDYDKSFDEPKTVKSGPSKWETRRDEMKAKYGVIKDTD